MNTLTPSPKLIAIQLKRAAMLALSATLFACGGGGGGTTSPTATTFNLSGSLSGLRTGLQVSIANGAGAPVAFSANGSQTFASNVPGTATYSLAISTQPVGQICSISNGSGTIAGVSVSNVAVSCADSLNLLAGGGSSNSNPDGTGASASFLNPRQIVSDAAGNLFVTDQSNHIVRKITPAGVVTTIAGSPTIPGTTDGTGTLARFTNPSGLTIDTTGNLYVSSDDNVVRKIDTNLVVSSIAGSTNTIFFRDGTGTFASFSGLANFAFGPDGNIYAASSQHHVIRKITPQGVATTFVGSPTVSGFADGAGSAALFNLPQGVAFDTQGNLYVAETGSPRIRKVTPAGVVSTMAGSGVSGLADGTGTAAQFNLPLGLVVDAQGNVYVADTLNDRIRKITPAGVVSTVIGTGTRGNVLAALPARISLPRGLALFDGKLFFTADNLVLWVYAP